MLNTSLTAILKAMTDNEFINYVDTLTDSNRVILRAALKENGDQRYLARNLTWNYTTQSWVDETLVANNE